MDRHSIGVRGVGSVVSAFQELAVYKEMEQRRLFQKRISTRTRVSEQTQIPNAAWVTQIGGGVFREEVN